MEPLTQRILGLTLVAAIKGVALAGLMAEVVIFHANRHADRIKSTVKKKASSFISGVFNQLAKN
jgi:hypothetical protein